MKKIRLEPLKTLTNKDFRVVDPDDPGTSEEPRLLECPSLVDMLKVLAFAIPRQKLTMQDSVHAMRFVEQSKAATDGILSLEDAEHDWLKKIVEDFAPMVFGVNAVVLKNALDNFERLHESKGEK